MSQVSPEEALELWGDEDDPDQYVVLAIDPGGTTGWAVIGVHPDAMSGDPDVGVIANIEFWAAGQFTGEENDQADEILALISHWPSARLVIEDFILRKQSQARELLSPVRLTSILEWAVRPRYFIKQQPSLAMGTITDDRQKAMGFWVPGQEHARDGLKHGLTFLKRQRDRQVKARRSMG
jgi:hypothetical protein